MSRAIKFRAWDKKFELMISEWPNGYRLSLGGKVEIFESDSLVTCSISNEYELMQYSGLKDKNGVEIYEGDILSLVYCKPQFKFPVIFHENGYWALETSDKTSLIITQLPTTYCEVIGNIHENPELLDQNKPKDGIKVCY